MRTRGTDEAEELQALQAAQEVPGWRWHAASGELAACLHFVFDRERGLRSAQLELVEGAG